MPFSFADCHDPDWVHFGLLRVVVENHIVPHEGSSAHPHRDAEIVTYVSAGIRTHGDDQSHEAGISAGEMQLVSAGSEALFFDLSMDAPLL
ncbi:pirin family protein [Salinibacter altiplanensis]|uniref:pirin family protein n=1 Tax=Salinibacter altiplanensis TaxID=1803181 RepID=UPI001E3092A8|nr:pirin family protein [Salinibacter altiplanensis]